jgi:ADP-heptose:LPS heptosyltransferase
MKKKVWIVNKGDEVFERTDANLKKHIILQPNRPIQMDVKNALRYAKFQTVFICENPEEYFVSKPMNRLIVRDAGIGDLLLLEPVLRQLSKNNTNVNIATRFPSVYLNSPYNTIAMENKEGLTVNVKDYDIWDDLRSYSERCENRDIKHRTDCYNQVFNLEIEDKEPRIYFNKSEKSLIKKKEGMNYIGLACDGSHFFRRYFYGNDLIDYILKADEKNVVVLLGDGWEDGKGFVKCGRHKRLIDYQGKTTIRQAINMIKDLDYMISVDTGLMHIALSMHIPTVGIFSIVKPDLRIDYYRGQKEVIYKQELYCAGCGSFHMARCKHEKAKKYAKEEAAAGRRDETISAEKVYDKDFVPPCLEITPNEVYEKLKLLHKEENKNIFVVEDVKKDVVGKKVNLNYTSKKKLVMPIIVLNEEKNLPRFIELVMSHPCIGEVVAIDGGSNDRTVELLKKAGANVFVHPYNKDYHDMQALQRNISCSFVKDGQNILIMDIDECFSDELSEYLPVLCETNTPYMLLSRRTFKYFNDIDDPSKQIKDYPDWQPRFFKWDRRFKWVGSPHHNIYNAPNPTKMRKDIIHFECEGKDRAKLEGEWSAMQKKTMEVYGK